MEYGKLPKPQPGLGLSSSFNSHFQTTTTTATTTKFHFHLPNSKLKLLLFVAGALLLSSAISAVLVLVIRSRPGPELKPSQAMSRTCSRTRYPALCLNSLLEFPGALTASDQELVHISVNITLNKVGSALSSASEITNLDMDPHIRSAYADCLELLEDSVSLLDRSLISINPQEGIGGSREEDVVTWLSASLTNQDTCTQGLDEVEEGYVKKQMRERVQDLSELVSNSLAIYSTSSSSSGDLGLGGVPIIENRRKLMGDEDGGEFQFPKWVSRALLDMAATSINADVVVSKDGNGSCKTVGEAIKKAPDHGNRRFIIYVRAGRYEENNLKVGRKKTNVMLIGEGKGKTVISGGKSVQDKLTTFHTASFAATGSGFIARDITFENRAGPTKHQAVALRVGADHAVIYRCNIIGYQDTLYTHSQRQFYRECDIYGTVDFIFGNAAVVFQNCTIHARKPLPQQKNTITAQNRKDPNQNTGISIHACRLVAEAALEAARGEYPTYLGRPWKMYARTVYMQSYLGDHIHPRGWLEWNTSTFALDTLYYGEYMNYGPGAGLTHRVNWPGYRVIKSATEAGKFTVAQFIYGSSWLPATGVAFMAGLST